MQKNAKPTENSDRPKPSLAEVQRWFHAAVTCAPARSSAIEDLLRITESTPSLTARDRVAIYSQAWFLRLEESLRDDYPALSSCLGAGSESDEGTAWEKLVADYIRKHPSQSYTLAHAGDSMPEFVSASLHAQRLPWLADLAKLEKAYYQTFRAADPISWDSEQLKNLSLDEAEVLEFELQPNARLFESDWDVEKVWLQEGGLALQQKCCLLVHRRGFSTEVVRIKDLEGEWALLKRLSRGLTLGGMLDLFPDEKWLGWLSRRGRDGILRPRLPDSRKPAS